MVKFIKAYLKTKPRLYDLIIKFYRTKDLTDRFFDEFSKSQNKKVNFIQIGASDGLRWDSIRKYIVRDRWNGILIEPLPVEVFKLYKQLQGNRNWWRFRCNQKRYNTGFKN